MTPRLPPQLVALSPGDLDRARAPDFAIAAARAVAAGLRGILLREPGLGDGALLDLTRRLSAVLAPGGGWLAVHDRPHLALAGGARGVHLGFRSLTPAEVRREMGEGLTIGFSSHRGDRPALFQGADYLHFGPLFPTPSKRGWVEPVGLAGLAWWTAQAGLPVWAIGGLRPEHARDVRSAGAAGLAVRRGIFGAPDPARACGAYLEALAS